MKPLQRDQRYPPPTYLYDEKPENPDNEKRAQNMLHIYAVFDNEANTWNTPWFQPTATHAIRTFKTEINRADSQNNAYLYPKAFDLYYLGQFDENDGRISPNVESKPQLICNGLQVKQEQK